MMLLLMSGVRLWSGRSSDAAEAAGRALAVFEAIGDRFGSAQARANVGRALVTSGRVDEGLKIMREAVDRHPALGDMSDPDQLELLEGVSLAGAAVQIGDSSLALMALGGEHGPDFEPETIGHGDALVAESLALLQAGRIEAAVERLLPYIESDPVSPSPYGQSVLALALAAAGHDEDVLELVVQVDAAPRATYLDKFNARLAELLVLARRGDRDDALKAYEDLCAHTDAVDDPVAQAIVRLGAAVAFGAQGWVAADAARIAADRRLEVLDIRAEGWRTVFSTAMTAPRVGASVTE